MNQARIAEDNLAMNLQMRAPLENALWYLSDLENYERRLLAWIGELKVNRIYMYIHRFMFTGTKHMITRTLWSIQNSLNKAVIL